MTFGIQYSFAFTLEPQYVTRSSGGVISIASDYSPAVQLFIFRTDTGAWIANTDTPEITITDADWDGSTHFWIVPVVSDSTGWGECAYTFDACILDEAHYVSSIGYQQLYYVPEGGAPASQEGGSSYQIPTNSRPQIQIISPTKGSVFSRQGSIVYESFDSNDKGFTDIEKSQSGLADNPVSLFYSDKVDAQNYTIIDSAHTFPIISGLPAIGTYGWSIKDLVPGIVYRIIATVIDKGNLQGEAISDFFTVDYTSPVFKVTSDSPAVRKGNVVISIDSSEDLATLPEVIVTQKGGKKISVVVQGEGSHFEGTYSVYSGYDGLATVSVVGKDRAGNSGSEIISGGSFSVGVNPPDAPVIVSPLQKSVVTQDMVTIKGSGREDTQIILFVNGVERAKTTPDSAGNFEFTNIRLEKTKNQGINFLSIVAKDAFDVLSNPVVLEVKQNVPPALALVAPKNNTLVSDSSFLDVQSSDINGDVLLYTYQVAPFTTAQKDPAESMWNDIGDATHSSGFTWNATDVDDGEYMLRVIADDGFARATTTPVRITVRNTTPFLRFENGRRTVTTDSNVTLYARAVSSNNTAVRSNIKDVQYSMDGGHTWILVKLTNSGTPYDRKFFVTLPSLKEGVYPIVWKIKDERGIEGHAIHSVVIDRTNPQKPLVSFPRNNSLLSNQHDENASLAGIQVGIKGSAEPGSKVVLSLDTNQVTTKTSIDGYFYFPQVTFLKRGTQDISLYALDEAGNKSKMSQVVVTYNNPPRITFIKPKPFHGIAGTSDIVWNITDIDGDAVSQTSLSYRRFGDTFKDLVINTAARGTFTWATSRLPEADDYELKITTTDGITPVTSIQSISIDRTPPEVTNLYIDRKIENTHNLTALGTASDSVAGIEYVEYAITPASFNGEKSWYKALITKGFLSTRVSYVIKHPIVLPDDTYVISVKAIDAAGNVSKEVAQSIKIDGSAPRVGVMFVDVSGVQIVPDDTNTVYLPKNTDSVFTVSLEADTVKADLGIWGRNINLKKNVVSGLWEAPLFIDTATTTYGDIHATDSMGNTIETKKAVSFHIFEKGNITFIDDSGHITPLSNVLIRILVWDDITKSYKPFISEEGNKFEIMNDTDGDYAAVLPQGVYRVVATKSGFKTVFGDINLNGKGFISLPLVTEKISGISLWIDAIINWLRY